MFIRADQVEVDKSLIIRKIKGNERKLFNNLLLDD